MAAYWLTYTLDGWPIENLRDLVKRFERDPINTTEWWRISSHRSAKAGDRVYMFKQGSNPRGIFGYGTIVHGPEEKIAPTDPVGAWRAEIRFEALVDPTERMLLPLGEIINVVPTERINAQSSGTSLSDDIAIEIERQLKAPTDSSTSLSEPELITRQILARRGQKAFRDALMSAYGNRCAVTGCPVEEVLEAAHIRPFSHGALVDLSQDDLTNGLLLRADIHTLFDCNQLAIDPTTRRVVVAERLKSSTYSKLADQPLRRPKDERCTPRTSLLEDRFRKFKEVHNQHI